jgi:DNA-directed RNA polymerase subunit RPC12/RpoP
MATCPACDHDVRTPYFFNLEGWSHLACPHCKARLEMKPRPVGPWLLPILVACSWLGRSGHTFALIAEVLLVAATLTLILLLIVRPQVRLRKRPLPKPEIRLNIDGSSK